MSTSPRARIAEALCGGLAEYLTNPPDYNPFERKERSGWFNCSDFNRYGGERLNPRRLLKQYLDLPLGVDAKPWTAENGFNIAVGLAIDCACRAALQAAGINTQVKLVDPDLRLKGTPDFALDFDGEPLVGDVKSTSPETFRQHWGNDSWDISRLGPWRQLQLYLMLADCDRGLFVAVNRAGPARGRKLADCFKIRWYERDEPTIDELRRDLDYLNEQLDRYHATGALPSAIY